MRFMCVCTCVITREITVNALSTVFFFFFTFFAAPLACDSRKIIAFCTKCLALNKGENCCSSAPCYAEYKYVIMIMV